MTRVKRADLSNRDLKRRLRSEMTPAEKQLWFHLSSRQFQSLKFRRQHGIGPYIVDFYCPEKGVVIEIDGETHAGEDEKLRDQQREVYLRSLSLLVVRYTNEEVLKNLEGVLEDLARRIK